MRNLKLIYKNLSYNLSVLLLFLLFISKISYSNEALFEIEGNEYTDSNVIISLLKDIPDSIDDESSNYIIKVLNASNLFSYVQVQLKNNKYLITVKEFPNIDKIYFENNERLENDELLAIADQIKLNKLNLISLNLYINEIKNLYESFGYNNVKINYKEKIYAETNTADLFFTINEGKITKINQIILSGNDQISSDEIKQIIVSKTKTIRNIFANNNFKPRVVERDKYLITDYYKNKGYLEVSVDTKIEYLKSNKVNIYFNINEGNIYALKNINIEDEKNILNKNTLNLIQSKKVLFFNNERIFSIKDIQNFENEVSSIIFESGIKFFEITSFEKIENKNVEILLKILPISPKYTNQINIVGNSRTFDNVIRRELEVVEGDAVYQTQYQSIRDKLLSLNLFENVNVKEEVVEPNKVNIIIEVEEKQTGSFNAGVSVGTLDGFAIVTGLKERNFYGTGRSLDFLVNTSKDKNQFKLITTDRLSYENDADISYSIDYKQEDYAKASSFKLDTFSAGIGIGYKVNENLFHKIDLDYVLKDYRITNTSTASNSILNSSGGNMSYLITNNLRYTTINKGFIPKKGNYINFNNTIETPTSSSNGFVRNIINLKKYHNIDSNIFSIQGKIGNIFSLNNNDILTDDKFALGGRWLRGFDNYGVGPRNSRTSYVGGNNLAAIKLDYSYEVTQKSNFPIYLNIFNDYGLLWDNKTKPNQSDNSVRSSAGFGIKYYSPVGPIGFTWGFPIMEEDYDIKRMFLFSIGNID